MSNIFDKVVSGLNKGVTSVSEGSKTIVEKAKLNTQLDEIKDRRKKVISELGNFVYTMYSKNEITIDKCQNMFNEISDLDKYIEEINKQIKIIDSHKDQYDISDVKKCPYCNADNKGSAKFCVSCGKSFMETKEVTE